MRLFRLAIRGFRNLADGEFEVPSAGFALVGPNGHGKTNLLEAAYYPVLFRSFRGAGDPELVAFGGSGFRIEAAFREGERAEVVATFAVPGRKKRVTVDGTDESRLSGAIGQWLAVAFLPGDVELAGGPAIERRRFLDRMLSLADPEYLRTLLRYRGALARRNAALRQLQVDVARACEPMLAVAGATLVRRRAEWAATMSARFADEVAGLDEAGRAALEYRGKLELSEPEAWAAAFAGAAAADRARGSTTVGPHRDDLALSIDGRSLRVYGSTGQLRTAAIALKLLELATLRERRGVEPALMLDDVFAELDQRRQERLAARLARDGERQLFVTAPRAQELPSQLALPQWTMEGGRVTRRQESA